MGRYGGTFFRTNHQEFLFNTNVMKAIIKVCTAGQFTQDQRSILKRVAMVLVEHDFSVAVITKEKKVTQFKLKVS